MLEDVKYQVVFSPDVYAKTAKAAEKVGMTVGEFIRTNVGLAVREVLSDGEELVPANDSEVAPGEEAES